ncbi:MAG TPA: FAD-binding protein [Polyangiales bacterium]|nr:FAD-binding protein [Polyangiales bacterium]
MLAATDATRSAPAYESPHGFDQDLAALLGYRRSSVGQLACPGLLQAGSCGDGRCDADGETSDSCPSDCVKRLVGAYNDMPICPHYVEAYDPTSIEEVQRLVRAAVREGKRVRVLGASHSASGVICGDGVALRMGHLADVTKTELRDSVAYVQPGVTMIELGDYLYKRGLSIGYTQLGFRGVTVAGVLGTSAHGSSSLHSASLSERLVSLQLVMADGTLRSFHKQSTPEDVWRALTTHLGVFGAVVQVGLAVEPAFNLDMQITTLDEAELLDADGPLHVLEGCDFGQLNWFPTERKIWRWCGKRSDAAAVDANNQLLDPGVSTSFVPFAKTLSQAGLCWPSVNAMLEKARFASLPYTPPILTKDDHGDQHHVDRAVGPGHRMMSGDLIALGPHKVFSTDFEVAIPQQHIASALRIARQVFDAHHISLPGVGAFLRFTKIERGGWLTYHGAGEQFVEGETAMFFETPVVIPVGFTDAQLRDYLYPYEQLLTLFIRYFGARCHWGKNSARLFDVQTAHGTYAGRIEKVNAVLAELDPYGVFSNDFASRIGMRWPKRD